MPDKTTQEIKDKISVVDLISEYVELKPAGANHKGLCPFHGEKTPSFMVSEDKQIWHCFGCSEGGDIFTFIEKIEGVDFKEALRTLAKRAGVEIGRQDPRLISEKNKLYALLELTTKFFQKALRESRSGQTARNYLKMRQIDDFSVDLFRIGYAPDSFNVLSNFLQKKGFSSMEIFKAGLTVKKKNGGFYDRFRDRLIFPIVNAQGNIVGFGGRILKDNDNAPKYINSPETEVYHKSELLYGLNLAKTDARKRDYFILVEGYMDVIGSHKAGISNVIAASGTALTIDQLKLIKRFSKNVKLCFDMDLAGENATRRGVDLAILEGLNVKIITLPSGKDPDDLVREDKKAWIRAIKNAKSIFDHYFDKAFMNFNFQNVEEKKNIFSLLIPLISKIPNQVEKTHYIQKLADKLKIQETVVVEEMEKDKNLKSKPNQMNNNIVQKKNISSDSDIISISAIGALSIVLCYPELFEILEGEEIEKYLVPPESILASKVKLYYNQLQKRLSRKSLQKKLEKEDGGLAVVAGRLILKLELEMPEITVNGAKKEAEVELKKIVFRIKQEAVKRRLKSVLLEMRSAESENSEEKIKVLSREFEELRIELLKSN